MTHELCQEFIQRELDHDLSAAELQQLEEHVQSCPDCREEREAYQKLAFSMQSLPKVLPERDLAPEITLDVLHSLQPQHVLQKPKRRFALWSGLSVAAVAVLAIGLTNSWGADQKQAESGTGSTPEVIALKPEDDKAAPSDANAPAGDRKTETPDPSPDTDQNGQASAGGTSDGTTSVIVASHDPASNPGSSGQQTVPSPSNGTEDMEPDASVKPPATADQPKPEPARDDSTENGIAVAITVPGTEEQPAEDGPVVDIATIGGGEPGGHYGITSTPLPPETSPAVAIGSAPLLPQLNGDLQQAVLSGDASAQWAADPFQVVTRHLPLLGFSKQATVSTTARQNVIRVVDNRTAYRITLHQPFQPGEKGIWAPLRIDRSLETNPVSYDLPVLEFFRQLQASGEIISFSALYAQDEFQSGQLLVSVDLTKQKNDQKVTERWHYLFTLEETQAGAWKIKTHTARQ